MTNSRAVAHKTWMVRCSPAPGFYIILKTKNNTIPNIKCFTSSWKQSYTKHKKCCTKLKSILHPAQKALHQTFRILHQIIKIFHQTQKTLHQTFKILHQPQKTLHQTFKILQQIIKVLHQTFFTSPNQKNFTPN